MIPSLSFAVGLGRDEERARCVRIIKRHIAFWQRIANQEMIAELRNILQEIRPTTGAGDDSSEEGQHAE
jgi:hypothetical protein